MIKSIIRNLLALFGIKVIKLTPMEKVLYKLNRKGIDVENLNALEVFGYIGTWHTLDYARIVKSLDVWEIDPECERFLRSNLPMADIKITNSFEEIKTVARKYNFIVVDNSMGIYGENGEYCEHFDLFPAIFRVMQDECVLVLNVIPKIEEKDRQQYPYLFNAEQLKRREQFYITNHPDNLSFQEMVNAYSKYAEQNGFRVEWFFTQKRSSVYYLVIKLKNREITK